MEKAHPSSYEISFIHLLLGLLKVLDSLVVDPLVMVGENGIEIDFGFDDVKQRLLTCFSLCFFLCLRFLLRMRARNHRSYPEG